jgi:hypothetical protein
MGEFIDFFVRIEQGEWGRRGATRRRSRGGEGGVES